jgi:hypothetical protein
LPLRFQGEAAFSRPTTTQQQKDNEAVKATSPTALIVQWRERAQVLHAEGCSAVAAARERCANELEALLHTIDTEALSIDQAANESGYSAEHLRRILRKTPALNAGRAGKPLILRRNVPRKAKSLVGTSGLMYDPVADARSLLSRQGAT